MTFDEWSKEVESLCVAHLACTWNDLCGEAEPLKSAFHIGQDPLTFVQWWAEKYDLHWIHERNRDRLWYW